MCPSCRSLQGSLHIPQPLQLVCEPLVFLQRLMLLLCPIATLPSSALCSQPRCLTGSPSLVCLSVSEKATGSQPGHSPPPLKDFLSWCRCSCTPAESEPNPRGLQSSQVFSPPTDCVEASGRELSTW